MKPSKYFLILFILSITVFSVFSQADRPFRIEMQAPEEAYPYDVINLGAKGVIVFFENQILSKSQASWRFVYYDAFFKKKWYTDVVLNRFMEPKIDYSDSNVVALIFKYEGKKKVSNVHQLVSIRMKDTLKTIISLPIDKDLTPNVLYADEDRALFSFYDDNNESFYQLKYSDSLPKKINFPEVKNSYVQFVTPIAGSTQLLVGVRNDISKKENKIVLYRISVDGLIVSNLELPSDASVFFNRCKIIQLNNDSMLVLGSYVLKNSIPLGFFTPANEVNTGVFSVLIPSLTKTDSLHLYNFSYNKMIFKYLSTREQEKMKKKVELDNPKDQSLSLNLQLLNHPIIKTDSSVIFISEAYYPEFRTEENVNYDFNGRPFPNNRTYFEGYRYTNAIVCGFDYSGKLIWDNNFSLNEMLSYDLKPRVSAYADSNNVLMAYSFEGNVVTMAVNGYNVVQNIERTRIEPMNSSDFIVKTEKSQVDYWYKNYFLSYGYQKIKSSGKGAKNRDNAFFLNKMIYKNVD
ncbi:MAG: hypothetical protein WCP69_06000 [Bacteroidota bacterium]